MYYQQDWLTIPQFKVKYGWSAGKESTKAYCKRCSKTFELSNMGMQAASLKVMLYVNLLYSFHALCCTKIKM